MRMRRHAALVGEKRYSAVPQTAPQIPPQAGLAAALYQDGDRDTPTEPKTSQFHQPSLIVHGGPQDGATIPICKPAITMGCLPDNDIVVVGPLVSRRHAEIVRMDAGFYIWDLGISNGTFVNQQHIGEMTYLLKHGDQIRLADSNTYHVFSYVEAFSHSVVLPPSVEEALGLVPRMPEPQEPPEILETTPDCGQSPDGCNGAPEQLESPSENGIYEGNVKLRVEWDGRIQLLIDFVTKLRTWPMVRVVRLVGNSTTDVEICLALREPLRLEEMLAKMEGVSQLTELSQEEAGPGGTERVLDVRLSNEFSQDLPPFMNRLGTGH